MPIENTRDTHTGKLAALLMPIPVCTKSGAVPGIIMAGLLQDLCDAPRRFE